MNGDQASPRKPANPDQNIFRLISIRKNIVKPNSPWRFASGFRFVSVAPGKGPSRRYSGKGSPST